MYVCVLACVRVSVYDYVCLCQCVLVECVCVHVRARECVCVRARVCVCIAARVSMRLCDVCTRERERAVNTPVRGMVWARTGK